MNIGYLEEYLELVSTMNYTVAARRLNITQSALSKHIAALEREFGCTFIDRSKQQIELTQQGRLFCEEASKILDAYQTAHRRLRNVGVEVRVAGALNDSAIHNIQSRAQDALRETGSSIRIVSQDYPTSALIDALKEDKVDLIIDTLFAEDAGAPGDPALTTHYLTSVPLLAVVARTHPLASRDSITLEELATQRILHPMGSMTIQQGSAIIESIFIKHELNMRKRIFYASSWHDFPSVEFEDDVFIMPRSLYSKQLFGSQLFDALHGIAISDDDARFPYGTTSRSGESNPAILHYIEALQDAARSIES